MLPGAKITVDEDATMIVPSDKHIFLYDANKFPTSNNSHDTYPRSGIQNNYRDVPQFGFNGEAPAEFIVNGTLNVQGALGGAFTKGANGVINIPIGVEHRSVTIKEVVQSGTLPKFTLEFIEKY